MRHKPERRPGSGEIWLAVTKHDRVQVDSILIDQAKFGEALRQVRASNFDLPVALGLQLRIAASRSPSRSLALGPTEFNERRRPISAGSATPRRTLVPLHPIQDDRRPSNA